MNDIAISRRLLLASTLALMGGCAQAQDERVRKFKAWTEKVAASERITSMSNAKMLGFASDMVSRKQLGHTRDGVQRLIGVVVPEQADGIILAMGFEGSKTFNVHRTGLHLNRLASVRNLDGKMALWSGPDCDKDFQTQINFWIDLPIS